MRRIPATIVTGFLGAGKTSLVRHLLAPRRRASAGRHRQRVRRARHRPRAAARLRRRDLRRGRYRRARQWLPLLHRGRRFPADPDPAARPRRAARAISSIETSGLALPKPLVQAFAWPEIRTRMTVDGVFTVIDAAAVAAGRFADDPEAVARQRARRPGARPRQSARGGVHRPARLRRSRDSQQDRSARPGRAWRRCAPRSRRGCGRGSSSSSRAQGRVPPAVALGLAAAPRTISPRAPRSTSSKASTITTISRALSSSAARVADVGRVPRPPRRRDPGARRAARQGLSSTCRAATAGRSCRRSATASSSISIGLAGRRDARDAARRDRPQGSRPRRDRARRSGAG